VGRDQALALLILLVLLQLNVVFARLALHEGIPEMVS
jgi:hypothetical protein